MSELNKIILIAGGTGLIGRYLSTRLQKKGYRIRILTRNKNKLSDTVFYWDPDKHEIDESALSGVDVIVNLAGAGISDKLWTRRYRDKIYNSRILATRLLANTVATGNYKPKLWINASAIGYYGNRPGEKLDELSESGTDFLSKVCRDWEAETLKVIRENIPVSVIRIGIVLSKKGGGLPKFLLPVKFGFDILFGNGSIPFNWIHITDLSEIIEALIRNDIKPDIYNAVSPEPVTQLEFNAGLKKAIGKKTLRFFVPKILFKLLPGEMGTIFTNVLVVKPKNLQAGNFRFRFASLNSALNDLLT